jgi:hypothetical protein
LQPSDRDERLVELVFINSLVQLLQASQEYTDVDPQALRSSSREARIIPDITCWRAGKRYVIECKSVAPSVPSRIQRYLSQLKRLAEAYPDAQIVLAVPEALQEEYKAPFKEAGYRVWDIGGIVRRFGLYINQVADSSFRALLLRASTASRSPSIGRQFAFQLKGIACGRADWSAYQKLLINIFEHLFVPPLAKALYEVADEPKVNRRDIILPNYADAGFWRYLRGKFVADFIVIDAKNYCAGIKKNEILQVANYLKHSGAGMFGIICSRFPASRSALLIRREQWTLYGKMIVLLTDADITQMLTLKDAGDEPEQVLRQRIEEFRLSL